VSRGTSRATCRGTRTRGGDEVVDDEPGRGGVVDERRGEPRDEPGDVPKQPEARRRKIDSAWTRARRLASMDLVESTSGLILLTRVLRIHPVVMITPTWRASCRCFRPENLPRGTRGSRLCGEDRDRLTENSKVCARTRDTRFIQVRVARVATLRPVWSSIAPCAWVVPRRDWGCEARYPALLYIVQGAGS
jgi:hypothetical protein